MMEMQKHFDAQLAEHKAELEKRKQEINAHEQLDQDYMRKFNDMKAHYDASKNAKNSEIEVWNFYASIFSSIKQANEFFKKLQRDVEKEIISKDQLIKTLQSELDSTAVKKLELEQKLQRIEDAQMTASASVSAKPTLFPEVSCTKPRTMRVRSPTPEYNASDESVRQQVGLMAGSALQIICNPGPR